MNTTQASPATRTVKALGLCSGGLDSILSALVLRDQGIAVTWVSFETPFFSADKARAAAAAHDIPLLVRDITPRYLEMMKAPPAGFGKNMNPCMDCHSLMFHVAGEMMESEGYDFLFSGEVMGQRPMSQNRSALRYVEKHSQHDGRILRPLSAKCLPPTPMEESGLVDRERLLDLSGRTRKPQMALAEKYGVKDYPSPAGGCLLTDKGYSQRLCDLFDHQETYTPRELHLLKHGRHLRLTPAVKIAVGRTQAENTELATLVDADRDLVLKVMGVPGPTVVIPNGGDEAAVLLAASICAGYSKASNEEPAQVQVASGSDHRLVTVLPLPPAKAKRYLI
ncbi:MAG: tRNA 4-thiouridine(8) synthase ThiI [Desulfosarcinaceae bacterium]|nr:tRNA 4-thiouridine(8) synthase ThiI [Desulfosarcinaceae bacterium]